MGKLGFHPQTIQQNNLKMAQNEVSFHERVTVKSVPYWWDGQERRGACVSQSRRRKEIGMSDIWYTSDDYREMLLRDERLCRSANKKTLNSSKDDSLLGLVPARKSRSRRRHLIDGAKFSVLSEQASRWDDPGAHHQADIAQAYESYSEEARVEALHRGVRLATNLLQDDIRSASISSVHERDLPPFNADDMDESMRSTGVSPVSAMELNLSTLAPFLLMHPLSPSYSYYEEETDHISKSSLSDARWSPNENSRRRPVMIDAALPSIPIRR